MYENTVELIGHYGDDKTHALSAWTSTARELTDDKINRIPALLKMLAENGHHTPFEKSTLHFLITADTASHIHILKHRIGVSVNSESLRYKEIKEDKYLLPADWPADIREKVKVELDDQYKLYHKTIQELEQRGLSRKRAKESARFVLPYANQLILDVTFNFRSFMHFLSLRHKPDAQVEINQISDQMLSKVRSLQVFENSLKAFGH